MYAKVMEINYWGSTECKRATYDEASVDREGGWGAHRPGVGRLRAPQKGAIDIVHATSGPVRPAVAAGAPHRSRVATVRDSVVA